MATKRTKHNPTAVPFYIQEERDVLVNSYPTWRDSCIESARFLRSGKEYEAHCLKYGVSQLPPEEREIRAKNYEIRAAWYQEKIDKFNAAKN